MRRHLLPCIACLVLAACGGEDDQPTQPGPSVPDAPAVGDGESVTDDPAAVAEAVLLAEKVKIKTAAGEPAWEIKPKDDGAKLVDGQERELARYTVSSSGKVKIKGPDDSALGAVEGRPGKWRVVDPDDTKLFVAQRADDGDWKIEAGADEELLAKIKRRDYGWKIVDPDEELLGKAKVKDGKTSLRGPDEETRYYTKDALAALALAVLAVEEVPLPLRMGLALKLHHEAQP